MTDREIIELAEKLGLHWDHDDDPDIGDETIYLWHDADAQPDGGVLIAFHSGKAHVTDVKNWGGESSNGYTNGKKIGQEIQNYAGRWNRPPEPMEPPKTIQKKKRRSRQTEPQDRTSRQLRSQRKEGAFKAVDPLGHCYYVEVFREMMSARDLGPLSLVTTEGESVERIGKGQYRLTRQRIELTTDDPAAP
jgi:hypothetical protein